LTSQYFDRALFVLPIYQSVNDSVKVILNENLELATVFYVWIKSFQWGYLSIFVVYYFGVFTESSFIFKPQNENNRNISGSFKPHDGKSIYL